MIVRDAKNKEVEIRDHHWPLAESLFVKWGCRIEEDVVNVADVNDITPELSAWGVPWKHV